MEGWGLKECVPLSDVIIGGVPVESFKVPIELIREGAVCINFSSFRNFDGPAVKEKASIYVPSVGKVTIAVLLRNLVVSTERSGERCRERTKLIASRSVSSLTGRRPSTTARRMPALPRRGARPSRRVKKGRRIEITA